MNVAYGHCGSFVRMSRRASLVLLTLAACDETGAAKVDAPLPDAPVAFPETPARCGGGPGVDAQGVLFDSQNNSYSFSGATVAVETNPVRIEIVAATTAKITLFVDTAAREYNDVFAQFRLGTEISATQRARVIIDHSDTDCVAGRFEVALRGRVVGSFRTM